MKNDIRYEYLLKRKNILNKKEKSLDICQKIIKHEKYLCSMNIGLYKSLKDEVDTSFLISYSLELGKNVYLPKVVDDDLIFYKISKNEKYVLSPFHVEEPVGDSSKEISIDDMDLIIVPGVVFDKEGHRMGYGKGYYDRYLNDSIYKIGICFQEQLSLGVPVNENDVSMNEVITN